MATNNRGLNKNLNTMSPRFLTKSGLLTPYAFRCGYIERHGRVHIEWEHCCYHVKGFNGPVRIFESFLFVTEARAYARRIGDGY